MAGEDRVGNQSRRLAVSDPIEPVDALGAERVEADDVLQLAEQRLVGAALRDQDDRVRLERALVAFGVVDVRCGQAARLDLRRHVVRDDVDAQLVQRAVHVRRLEREVHVRRDVAHRGHDRHALALGCELLRE